MRIVAALLLTLTILAAPAAAADAKDTGWNGTKHCICR